jgi:hypothetical protein
MLMVAMPRSAAFAKLLPGGRLWDEQASLVYDTDTGYIALDAPWGLRFGLGESIESASGIFVGQRPAVLQGSDVYSSTQIARQRWAGSLACAPSYYRGVPYLEPFGTVAEAGLSEEYVLRDLSVEGLYCSEEPFDEVDHIYLRATSTPEGSLGDDRTSIVYDAHTGYIALDAPNGRGFSSELIESAAGILTGTQPPILTGSYNIFTAYEIFHGFDEPCLNFGLQGFGPAAEPGLSASFVRSDLTALGSLCGGGDLGEIDVIYVPEPSTVALLSLGVALAVGLSRPCRRGFAPCVL